MRKKPVEVFYSLPRPLSQFGTSYLFFPGQKTGLNDYLKNIAGAGLLIAFYLMENLSLVTVLRIPILITISISSSASSLYGGS